MGWCTPCYERGMNSLLPDGKRFKIKRRKLHPATQYGNSRDQMVHPRTGPAPNAASPTGFGYRDEQP